MCYADGLLLVVHRNRLLSGWFSCDGQRHPGCGECSSILARRLPPTPTRCIVVHNDRVRHMVSKSRVSNETLTSPAPRASITFSPEVYRTIEDLAKRKKVSIAWVVREAVEKYVEDQWPLLTPLAGE